MKAISGEQFCNESGLTGMELVILISGMILAASLLILFMNPGDPAALLRTFPGGIVADSVHISGDNLQPVGSAIGFAAVDRLSGDHPMVFTHPDPGKLGAVHVMISLFIGQTGAIDMDRANVRWSSQGSYEQIPHSGTLPLVCPNWTISGKYNLLPGHVADADNWLEPDEEFDIFACPSSGVQPYGMFSLIISPAGAAMPLTIRRTVPGRIRLVMNLG